jgi:MoaA/NifB/PqqE/SkfB family radical SAM enzyme
MNWLKLFKVTPKILFRKKIPLRIAYFCTFRCNLQCKYCGLWKTKREEMTTEQVKSMIDEFADAGTLFWMFTGGEPLLRKDIGELVTYVRNKDIVTGLVSNGVLLGKRLDELSDLNYIVISLDGPEYVNDKLRGKGSYNKALNSIKKAVDEGFDVTINSVISNESTKNDFEGLKEVISMANELGIKVNFSVLYEDFTNKGVSLLSEEKLVPALRFIKSQKKKANVVMSNNCINALTKANKWRTCYAGRLFCDVTPDGKVVPCLFKPDNGVNGLEHGFVKAFQMLGPQANCFCYSTCYNELNSALHMKPKAVLENFIKYSGFLLR